MSKLLYQNVYMIDQPAHKTLYDFFTFAIISQLFAGDTGIFTGPVVVTYSVVISINANFYSTIVLWETIH